MSITGCQYAILTGAKAFEQEAESPGEALRLFINRIKDRGEQQQTKFSRNNEVSLSLYQALLNKTLKLVVVSNSERPRKLFGGYSQDHYIEPITPELAEAVRPLLTQQELRSARW